MIYILIGFLIFILIIHIPFYVNILLIRKDNNISLEIKVSISKKNTNMAIRIPINLNKNSLKKNSFGENVEKDSNKKKYSSEMLMSIIKKINIGKMDVEKIVWSTKIGLNDAAATGIITGALWTFKHMIISLIDNTTNADIIELNITPVFSKSIFEIYFNCIIKIKLVNIIIIGFIVLKTKIRGDKSYVRSSN